MKKIDKNENCVSKKLNIKNKSLSHFKFTLSLYFLVKGEKDQNLYIVFDLTSINIQSWSDVLKLLNLKRKKMFNDYDLNLKKNIYHSNIFSILYVCFV